MAARAIHLSANTGKNLSSGPRRRLAQPGGAVAAPISIV
jgi:hypothetical protein